MKHIKLFESFDNNIITNLTNELNNLKLTHEVIKANDPHIEDDIIKLDNKFYFQISAFDRSPYVLWNNMKMLGAYKLPDVAVKMYQIEKKRIKYKY